MYLHGGQGRLCYERIGGRCLDREGIKKEWHRLLLLLVFAITTLVKCNLTRTGNHGRNGNVPGFWEKVG